VKRLGLELTQRSRGRQVKLPNLPIWLLTSYLHTCVMYGKGVTDDSRFIERALSTIRGFMEDERSIRDSVRNAVRLAHEKGFTSIAFPLIRAGPGGYNNERTKTLKVEELGDQHLID